MRVQRYRVHLTGSGRGVARRRRHTEAVRDQPVHLADRGLCAGPDVVGPHHRWGKLSGAHERVNDIIDVDVITDSGAVAVDGDRAAGEQGAAENRDHPRVAVRILARTVDTPQRERDRRYPVHFGV